MNQNIHKTVIDIHPNRFQKLLNKQSGKIVGDKSREEYKVTSWMPITKEKYYKLKDEKDENKNLF